MRGSQVHLIGMTALAGVISTLAGCQSAPKQDAPLLFFPAPPAAPRVQFLTFASGAEEVEPSRGSFEEFILGEEPAVQRLINKPYGIAARDGVVYVCDTKGLCICRLDFKNRRYSTFGHQGPGRLRKPINVAMDPLGYKFVADPERKQVVVFGPEDEYVTAFDVPQPCRPVDVAVHGNEVYVLDNDESCQVVVMDRRSGEVIRTFGGPGGEPGQFKIPNSLCVDDEGFVYVSDTHNWRMQKLTSEGEAIWVKGAPGYTLGRFGRPRGIRVGPDGIIYVVDGATEIVQMFNPEGQTLMRFGGPGNVPGALGLPSTVAIDKTSIPYFQEYIHEDFDVDYLLFVISQYGRHLVSVYAFGAFPEGYKLEETMVASLPEIPDDLGIGPAGSDVAPAFESQESPTPTTE
ncbi:MAG: hypothetical protein JSV78_01605, partial [Phycisphaerales bacterium]